MLKQFKNWNVGRVAIEMARFKAVFGLGAKTQNLEVIAVTKVIYTEFLTQNTNIDQDSTNAFVAFQQTMCQNEEK